MIRLSIIIPFYNVEQYIAQCLDSVYNQDIPEEEYEVICVNDASPDNSREIVKEYQRKHSNLILVEHEVNKKLGAARNTGRSVAKGQYIWNVDSDDMIAPNCLKEMLEICEKNDLDVLEFGYKEINRVSNILYEVRETSGIVTGIEYIKRYYIHDFGAICPVWRRVYKRKFLVDNNILSPPINMGEDEAFSVHVFTMALKVFYVPYDFYFYRVNSNSLVGESKQSWSAQKWYEASMVCPLYIDDMYQKIRKSIPEDIQQAIQGMIIYDILYIDTYERYLVKEDWIKYWNLCRRNFFYNLFVFRYLSRKKIIKYLKNIIKFGFL